MFAMFCILQEATRKLVTKNFLDNVYNQYCPYCPSARDILKDRISSQADEELVRNRLFDGKEFESYSKEMKELHDEYFKRYI